MGEDDVKRQKTEGGFTAKPEEAQDVEMKKEPEAPPAEEETDAKPAKGKPLKEQVSFETSDCTLNVIPALGGKVLMPLTDGGMQYLMAGARANVGIKQGRYVYEIKVVESLSPSEGPMRSNRAPMPRNIVKLGFSTQDSSLLIGEDDQSVCFDSEGFFTANKERKGLSQRLSKDQVIAVVLNLDQSSPNKNTVSLFKDGARLTQPQKLPESMLGKALFPHIGFKNVTLQVNFSSSMVPLPFKCHCVGEAPATDAVLGTVPPKDGKYEVLFPVAIPDEGTFDWLDDFLAKNPKYFELSDRAIGEWAEKSGVFRPRQHSWKHCNDKPDLNTGIPLLDDFSARRVLNSIVSTQPRNYVVMEVKSNLIKEERQQLLKRFKRPCYRTVAQVVMGEPPADFKAKVHKQMLEAKQEKADQEWTRRKAEKDREKQAKKRAREQEAQEKQREKEREKAEAEAKKAEEEAKKAEEEAKKKESAAEAEGQGGDVKEEPKEEAKEEPKEAAGEAKEAKDEAKEEDVKMEAKEEVKKEEEEEKQAVEPEEPEEPRPVAELTEEEKSACFMKKAVTDLTSWALGGNFTKFSFPDKAEEGFDEVRCSWGQEDAGKEYLKKWILKNKVLCRMEDLTPGEWFKSKLSDWERVLSDWKSKQAEHADHQSLEKANKEAEAAEAAQAEAEKKEGEEEGEKKPAAPEPEPPKAEVDDVFAVEDICKTANGDPLFAKFAYEDWVLLGLRAELHLLVHSFVKDANDPERAGIHEMHLAFYYNKYFKKTFNIKHYGVDSNAALLAMIKDAVIVKPESQLLQAMLGEDIENFDILVKLTEEARRERQRRLDSGEEDARLKFARPEDIRREQYQGGGGGYKGGGGGYKGGGYKGDKGFKGGFKGGDKGGYGCKGGFKGDFKGDGKGFGGKGFGGCKGGGYGKGGYGK